MKIGDRIFVRGYIDEIRKDTVIVRNDGGYFGTIPSEVITGELPSAQPERTGQKMTNAEAIETLIANYPDACFEQLREAVDAAIEALKAQPETIRPAWKADDRYVKNMFQPFPYCPKCNHYLITGDNYCSVCGRHIDWSEDDDTAD